MADLTITATSVVNVSGTVVAGILGETVTAGQTVYLKASDSRYWLAQADGTAAEADVKGIALNGGAAGQYVAVCESGAITIGATTAKNTTYVQSSSGGGICPTSDLTTGWFHTRIGYATSSGGAFVVDRRATGVTV